MIVVPCPVYLRVFASWAILSAAIAVIVVGRPSNAAKAQQPSDKTKEDHKTADKKAEIAKLMPKAMRDGWDRPTFIAKYPKATLLDSPDRNKGFREYEVTTDRSKELFLFVDDKCIAHKIYILFPGKAGKEQAKKLVGQFKDKLGAPQDNQLTDVDRAKGVLVKNRWIQREENLSIICSVILADDEIYAFVRDMARLDALEKTRPAKQK